MTRCFRDETERRCFGFHFLRKSGLWWYVRIYKVGKSDTRENGVFDARALGEIDFTYYGFRLRRRSRVIVIGNILFASILQTTANAKDD